MRRDDGDLYQAWLWGELLLLGLLSAAFTLFVAYPSLREPYELPELRLFLDTAVMLAATVVAVLAGVRFSVEGRSLDLLLCTGFSGAAVSTFAFGILPAFGAETLERTEAWAGVGGRLVGAALIAAAPLSRWRLRSRGRAVANALAAVALLLLAIWLACELLRDALPELSPKRAGEQPLLLTGALALQGLLGVAAFVGFALRFRSQREDLDRWLALGATLGVFAELHYVFTPLVSSSFVSQGDFLRLLSYSVLLAGVWRAIRYAEFGRAVAEERARVAREIHDGLAQYLFSISTHVSMLEDGKGSQKTVSRIKEAAAAAQQEARFAVLALSSASGNAPFDSALRRYVELLTADGSLEVDLEIDDDIRLAPDEQIEIFRIVQEGLANVRKHARARRARVTISGHGARRSVVVEDDGSGFTGEQDGTGHGLSNMRLRAETIGGAFRLRSEPGRGTALEVTLRA